MQVLIVDDEPVIRYGLSKMAETYSPGQMKVRTAVNGIEALRLIGEAEPDIVLTDIRMPKMDGLELCKAIHDDYPRIHMAVISGYGDFEYAQKSMAWGVKHYLLKPVTKSDVHDVLERLFKHSMRGYVSVTRYLHWVDRIEECVWSLQAEQLAQIIGQWQAECLSEDIPLARMKEMLGDCLDLLIERLQSRHYSLRLDRIDIQGCRADEMLMCFAGHLESIMNKLHTMRKGNFKDPMEEAKTYIDSRLSQDITLEEVACMVGLTPNYFSALFKKLTNETFVQYRIQKRMEKAKEMLAIPHYRISDIASEVGYEDYPHFTKTFKKIAGITPSEYRSELGVK
ncbi:DNA-binding response regulator [Paenibacillus sp. MY03]|jgi:two-component system response regulator YesN|uniref:response regulator transcription factor n=1 Tax=Paenibacillus sp. MY03 TaxID=302980 RepID=UPI000B3BF788|nr:response regulator [Paenibacillus sp. MY03]OUS76695.1 DNA-binding response regulator [Paenibacillus sp. MY03]